MTDTPTAPTRRDTREQRGWYVYDWANSAFPTLVITVFLGPYLTDIAQGAADPDGLVRLLGLPVAPESLFLYAVSASVVLQVLVLPVVGAIADRSANKKGLLGGFAFAGAAATTALVGVTGGAYVLGSALLVFANVAFGAAAVVYDSFLPEIATPDDRDRVSSRGWAFGYLGGGLLLAAALALFTLRESVGVSEADAARISLAAAGLWWAGWTIVPLRRLRNRSPLRTADGANVLTAGFAELRRTLRGLRGTPRTLGFLGAYLLYNDGVQTVIAAAAIFGDDELGLDQTVLIGTILLVQFVAFLGALLMGRIAGRVGAKRTVLAQLVLWTLVIAYGRTIPEGAATQFLVLGALVGVVLGGTQALSRSLYSHLVPPGREAEYFSLYQISERGTAWLGTATLGVAVQVTGSYRSGILVLIAFFVLGGAGLALVDMRRAIDDVGNPQPQVL